MYFNNFPYTYYTLDNNKTVQIVKNITLKVVLNDVLKSNYGMYYDYDVKDGETPEIVSYKMYNTTMLHWLILHMNDIVDPRFEWPLSNYALMQYVEGKYDNPNAVHHYLNSNGDIVNSTEVGAYPVSNFEYEDGLNESKRRIKVLKPQYVEDVVSLIKESLARA